MMSKKTAMILGLSVVLTCTSASTFYCAEAETAVELEEGTAEYYYAQGDELKNQEKDFDGALAAFVLGAACEETEENKEAIGNCLVQIGECCVHEKHGPNGETGDELAAYILESWERAGSLGAGTGYFDIALAYLGIDIPGAGDGSILGLPTGYDAQSVGVDYLYKALELNNGKAQRYIGICYWNGYGVEQSYEKAYELFSTTRGAELYIAYMQLYGFGGLEKDMDAALELLTAKAESMSGGNRSETQTARFLLAELYYTGSVSMTLYDGTEVTATVDELNPELAKTYLEYDKEEYNLTDVDVQATIDAFEEKLSGGNAAANEDSSSYDMTQVMAAYGLTAEDIQNVANVYKQLNEGNDPHLDSEEGYYDIELKLAMLGADMGNGELAKWVGEIYQGGNVEGVEEAEAVDIAITWFEKAAELGVPNGWTDIGLLYAHSSIPGGGTAYGNVEFDMEKAVEYYKKGFDEGDSKAARYIALVYHNGDGIEQNYEEAAKWFEIAADRGDTTAFWYLGDYYYNGTGVEQDYAKAIELYLVPAESAKPTPPGVKQSRYALGTMYEDGVGVEQNLDTAIEWYLRSAEANYEPALEALERLGVSIEAETEQ